MGGERRGVYYLTCLTGKDWCWDQEGPPRIGPQSVAICQLFVMWGRLETVRREEGGGRREEGGVSKSDEILISLPPVSPRSSQCPRLSEPGQGGARADWLSSSHSIMTPWLHTSYRVNIVQSWTGYQPIEEDKNTNIIQHMINIKSLSLQGHLNGFEL